MPRVVKRSAGQAVKLAPRAEASLFPASCLRSFPSQSRSPRRGRNGCTKSNSMAIEWPRGLTMAVRNC